MLVDRLPFDRALVHELTTLDREESTRKGWNPYALAHYLRAAEDVAVAVAAGVDRESAFADAFTPCRGMHKVAQRLGLRLDVQRGAWVHVGA